jgi:hypothetical protein
MSRAFARGPERSPRTGGVHPRVVARQAGVLHALLGAAGCDEAQVVAMDPIRRAILREELRQAVVLEPWGPYGPTSLGLQHVIIIIIIRCGLEAGGPSPTSHVAMAAPSAVHPAHLCAALWPQRPLALARGVAAPLRAGRLVKAAAVGLAGLAGQDRGKGRLMGAYGLWLMGAYGGARKRKGEAYGSRGISQSARRGLPAWRGGGPQRYAYSSRRSPGERVPRMQVRRQDVCAVGRRTCVQSAGARVCSRQAHVCAVGRRTCMQSAGARVCSR